MSGLVTLTIITDETGQIVGLIVSPRLGKERVEFLFNGLFAGIKGNHTFRIMGSEEQRLPSIRFTIHIGIIRIIRIEIFDPTAIGYLSTPETGTRIKQVLIVIGTIHQSLICTVIT